MANYTAVVYTPVPGLVTMHNAARIGGVNTFTTQGLLDITSTDGPSRQYIVGVIVPAVVMVIMFFAWLISLCFAKCCCKGCCSKNVALLLFTVACSTALIGWALALAGNVATTNGVNAMLNGVTAVQNYARKVQNLTDDAGLFATDLNTLANSMQQDCSNDHNVSFPIGGITGGLNGVIDQSIGGNGLGGQITSINQNIDKYKDMTLGYVAWRETGTMIVIIITIVVLFIFMVTTALRVMDSTPEACRPCLRFSSRSTSCVVFLFGILLLLIIWIFVAIIHVLATIGADLCAPSINGSINRLANEAINQVYNSTTDPCLDSQFRDSSLGVICYYQTCTGPNKVADLTAPIKGNSGDSQTLLLDFRKALNDSIAQFNTNVSSPNCFPSMDKFINGTTGIFGLVDRALELTTCPEINPVYAAFVYDGICNGLFGGLTFTYITAIIACVSMMFAMSIFRIFDFSKYEYGRLPEAEYIEPNKTMDSGGPIVQAQV
jgi:hypothetical protein